MNDIINAYIDYKVNEVVENCNEEKINYYYSEDLMSSLLSIFPLIQERISEKGIKEKDVTYV